MGLLTVSFPQLSSAQATKAEKPDPQCMRLGADDSLSIFYPLFENLAARFYEEAGFCATSVALPSKRIEIMLANNQLDADWLRMEDYPRDFNSSLIAVPVPLFQLDAVLLSMKDDSFDGEIAALQGRSVAYQSGYRWLEKHLPLTGAVTKEMPAGIPISDLLLRKRIKIFATDSVRASLILEELGDAKSDMRVTVWEKMKFFHLVHKRHREKIPALSVAIRNSINRGDFKKIYALPGLSRVD